MLVCELKETVVSAFEFNIYDTSLYLDFWFVFFLYNFISHSSWQRSLVLWVCRFMIHIIIVLFIFFLLFIFYIFILNKIFKRFHLPPAWNKMKLRRRRRKTNKENKIVLKRENFFIDLNQIQVLLQLMTVYITIEKHVY